MNIFSKILKNFESPQFVFDALLKPLYKRRGLHFYEPFCAFVEAFKSTPTNSVEELAFISELFTMMKDHHEARQLARSFECELYKPD